MSNIDITKEKELLIWFSQFPPPTRSEVEECVTDPRWQRFRASLHHTSLVTRLILLKHWMEEHICIRIVQVQALNYINALKRGGMIK